MQTLSSESLIAGLRESSAYPHPFEGSVAIEETHISWILLAGDYAYKIKKPLRTEFLDYGSLAARRQSCDKELQLNRRYAPDLYLDVVPITVAEGRPRIGGTGEVIEYAVKMRRFAGDALLARRLIGGTLRSDEVHQLARTVAEFHADASRALPHPSESPWGAPPQVWEDAFACLGRLRSTGAPDASDSLDRVERWLTAFAADHAAVCERRIADGFIRECHGDLHVANVVHWQGRWVPFDGIEFNERYRWIDVLSDAAFLAMDFAAQGHPALSHSFTSAYLEQSGDYGSLELLRWYLVYRALVRAMVAGMRAQQTAATSRISDVTQTARAVVGREAAWADRAAHIELACRYTRREPPRLWITHGLSGSGKTTGSEQVVQRCGAIRLRSDVERKRLYGLAPNERPAATQAATIYGAAATDATYDRLCQCSSAILRAGYSVVVDATFLQRERRQRFAALAAAAGVPLTIIDFQADEATLRRRIEQRAAHETDASDADLDVLEGQIAHREPLSADERTHTVASSDFCPLPER